LALKLITAFHILCWGVPLVLVCFAMGFNALGFDIYEGSVGWCWVAIADFISWPPWGPKSKSLFWKLIAGKGVELLTYFITPVVYIASKRVLNSEAYQQSVLLNDNARATLQDTDRKLVLIPIIFVVLRMWGTIRFVGGVYCPRFIFIYFLAILQAIGDSSQGFANCILFCFFTKIIRDKIFNSVNWTICSQSSTIN